MRVACIHALEESVAPARAAFAEAWPEAYCFDLIDTSLAVDRVRFAEIDATMLRRFRALADYARSTAGHGGRTAGILFTCSAFGPAIDALKADSPVPVLRPNEAAFGEALDQGTRIGLVVSFAPSLAALESEIRAMAAARGWNVSVRSVLAEDALEALKAGDGARHDRSVAAAAASLDHVDVVVLGQFSLARARVAVEQACGRPVISTPHSAVTSLRRMLASPGPRR